ncbi:hypothetical protein TRVA0_029S00188 [Trichomonascus vanleenenianus]|uniref:uncharacterized protein n=1 Tax=Trichomonascus vanleenenianus TaxID=2268995 RepID=UPI003ECB332B
MMNNSSRFQDFKWDDWLDTVEMRKMHEVSQASKADWPDAWEGRNPFEDLQYPPVSERSEEELAINGRIFLISEAPQPRKVILLGEEPRVVYINGMHGNIDKANRSDASLKIDSLDDLAADTLFPELTASNIADKVTVDMPMEMFLFNMTEKVETKIDPTWDLEKQKHFEMIKWASKYYKTSQKYFYEVPIKGHRWDGMHYDWRFFNKRRSERDHEAFRHHLLRTWSDFTNTYNILSWVSQGSLLGWKWNGMSLPWDNDHDIQMPVAELDRFARLFNQTLIVQDPNEGNGRYFVDVGPWYIERERGNGNNAIDARVIDTRSGVYIDITAIAATGDGAKKGEVHCKFNNRYKLKELSPLRRTLFEGAQVYIPSEPELLLLKKYGKFKPARGWRYDNDLRLWVRRKDCDEYMDKFKKFDADNQLTAYGGCEKEEYINEYEHSKLVTKSHYDEMDIYDKYLPSGEKIDKKTQKTINKEVAELLKVYHPPLRYDPL